MPALFLKSHMPLTSSGEFRIFIANYKAQCPNEIGALGDHRMIVFCEMLFQLTDHILLETWCKKQHA